MDISKPSGDAPMPAPDLEAVKKAASELQKLLKGFQKNFAPKVASKSFDTNRMEQFWEVYQGEIVQCCASALNNIQLKNIPADKFAEVEQHIGTIVQYARENPVSEDHKQTYIRMEKDFGHFKNRKGIFQKFSLEPDMGTEDKPKQPLPNLLADIKVKFSDSQRKSSDIVKLGVEAPPDEEITKKPRKERLPHQIDPMEFFNLFGDKENDEQTPPQGGKGRGR